MSDNIISHVKLIYQDLVEPEVLKKCLHGKTQIQNESFNSMIWDCPPKSPHCGLEKLEFAVYDAVATFNDGRQATLDIFKMLNVDPLQLSIPNSSTSYALDQILKTLCIVVTIINNKLSDWLGPIPRPGKLEEQKVVKGEADSTEWLQPTYIVTIFNSIRLPAWSKAIPTSERREEKTRRMETLWNSSRYI